VSERVSEQGLTSPPTQYRLYGRQFYRSKDPTNSIKVLKEDKNKHKKHNKLRKKSMLGTGGCEDVRVQ